MDNRGEIQVVMTPAAEGPFREWLDSRGLYLFPIPVEDDLPTYGVAPKASAQMLAAAARIARQAPGWAARMRREAERLDGGG